eukprot:7702079-Pyramimonas_sp.AAC.1
MLTGMAKDFVDSAEASDEAIIPEKWLNPLQVMTDGVKNKVVARSPAHQQFCRWLNDKATEQELADWEK